MDGTYSSFTADYMGKSVRVQGKIYPAGFSVPALLNAFPDGDYRRESNGLQMLYLQSDLRSNRLVAETFFRAGKEMRDTLLLLRALSSIVAAISSSLLSFVPTWHEVLLP